MVRWVQSIAINPTLQPDGEKFSKEFNVKENLDELTAISSEIRSTNWSVTED